MFNNIKMKYAQWQKYKQAKKDLKAKKIQSDESTIEWMKASGEIIYSENRHFDAAWRKPHSFFGTLYPCQVIFRYDTPHVFGSNIEHITGTEHHKCPNYIERQGFLGNEICEKQNCHYWPMNKQAAETAEKMYDSFEAYHTAITNRDIARAKFFGHKK